MSTQHRRELGNHEAGTAGPQRAKLNQALRPCPPVRANSCAVCPATARPYGEKSVRHRIQDGKPRVHDGDPDLAYLGRQLGNRVDRGR